MSHWDVDDSEQLKVLGAALKFRRAELDEAKAELARLTALLEDRTKLAKIVRDGIYFWKIHEPAESLDAFVADRLIAYLKGKE